MDLDISCSYKLVLFLGRIKPRFVKNVARYLVANYFDLLKNIWDKAEELKQITGNPLLAGQFRFNSYKETVKRLTNIRSKKMRNRVAGAVIRLMYQILVLERITLEELRAKYYLRPVETEKIERVSEESE